MKILSPQLDLDLFFTRLATVKQRLLLLDYDGTLAPFNVKREQAFPYPGVSQLLNDICDSKTTRLIIISGRSIQDLIPLLHLNSIPEIWGTHGWEKLSADGKYHIASIDDYTKQALDEAKDFLASSKLLDYCEYKPVSIALHWRGLTPELADSIRLIIIDNWNKLTEKTKLEIHSFDGGIELRVPGKNKGTAVKYIISGISEESAIAYLGDDLTDEDAFQAIKSRGLSILVRKELRPTSADLWLKPPEELIEFLYNWKQICIK